MKCPVCNDVNLLMSERQGIEIDYCPECRGIWLDRGELDKIIEKSDNSINFTEKSNISYNKHNINNYNHKSKKKESFLENVFDIFGD